MRIERLNPFLPLRSVDQSLNPVDRLLRAWQMIYPSGSGYYVHGPLLVRTMRRFEALLDLALEAAGATEIHLPLLQPVELWKRSGRFSRFGGEMLQVETRKGRSYLLSPTSEEQVSAWLAQLPPLSQRAVPLVVFQKGPKFRDEAGAGSVIRSREFFMYEAYFWATDEQEVAAIGDSLLTAVEGVFDVLGLPYARSGKDRVPEDGDAPIDLLVPAPARTASRIELCPTCRTATGERRACPRCGSAEPPVEVPAMPVVQCALLGSEFSREFGVRIGEAPLPMGCIGFSMLRIIGGVLAHAGNGSAPVWPSVIAPALAVLVTPGLATLGAEREAIGRVYQRLADRAERGRAYPLLHRSIVLDDRDVAHAKRIEEWRERGVPFVLDAGTKGAGVCVRLRDQRNGTVSLVGEDEAVAVIDKEIERIEEAFASVRRERPLPRSAPRSDRRSGSQPAPRSEATWGRL